MPGKRKEASFSEMGGLLKETLNRAATRPTIFGYQAHEKQIDFHTATTRGRLYIGGNRSGKTVGGIAEDIYRLRGQHPYRRVHPGPVRGRIVTVSLLEGINKIIIPELQKWIPPSDLINGSWEDSYVKSERTLKLANGSYVELMTYDQDLEKFAGTSRHFVHFDEEPPKDIFNECRMRLIDTEGDWYITMTPVEGMTWVYDDLYMPGISKQNPNITVITIDTEENPYISKAEVEDVMSDLTVDERKARKEGKFVQIGGRAFSQFNPEFHILKQEFIPPLEWTHYASMDYGFNAPTAWLWHAVSPNGTIVTYDEIYDNERVVTDYAIEIHEKNKLPGRKLPDFYVGDPSIVQRNGQTGDSIQTAYAMEGIYIILGNNDQKIGVEKMNRYLKQSRWFTTPNCYNLNKELQRQRWKIYTTAKMRNDNPPREELDRKHSHAPDSARYFFSLMPDLRVLVSNDAPPVDPNKAIQQALGAGINRMSALRFDQNLKYNPTPTEWTVIDDTLGGEW